jgi:hypothetical protein
MFDEIINVDMFDIIRQVLGCMENLDLSINNLATYLNYHDY